MKCFPLLFSFLLLCSLNASAQGIVSLSFGNSGASNQNVNNLSYMGPLGTGSAGLTAGVVEAGFWNELSIRGGGSNYSSGGSLVNLLADDGAASALDVSFSFPAVGGPTTSQVPASTPNERIYRGQIIANTVNASMNLSDLSAFLAANSASSYDVYLYGVVTGNVADTGRFRISDGSSSYYQSAALTSSTPWFDGSFTEVSNTQPSLAVTGDVVRFSGLSSDTLTVTVSNENNSGNPLYRWSAVQVVAIPEPGTLGLLAVALGTLALLRRRDGVPG